MTPLRKRLITLGDIVENAKSIARRHSDATAEAEREQLAKRLRFLLREIETEAFDTGKELARELVAEKKE